MTDSAAKERKRITGTVIPIVGGLVAAVIALTIALMPGASLLIFPAILSWVAVTSIILAVINDENGEKRLLGWLEQPSLYQDFAGRSVNRMWGFFAGNDAPEPASWRQAIAQAMTWRLLDRALLIAVVYPLLALFGFWLFGFPGSLGGEALLPASDPLQVRLAVLVFFVLLFVVWKVIQRRASRRVAVGEDTERRFLETLIFLALILAWFGVTHFMIGAGLLPDSGAFAGAFLGAVAFAGAVAFSGVLAVGFVFAVAFSGAFAVSFVISFVGAIISISLLERLVVRGRRPLLAYLSFIICALFALGVAVRFGDFSHELAVAWFLFLGLFPLLNALLDFVSYAVTLGLLKYGLGKGRAAFGFGAVDLILALLLFFALGLVLILGVTVLNWAAGAGGPLLNLPVLLAAVRAAPGDYGWLYLMLFSTLAPTAAHFLTALLSTQAYLRHLPLVGPPILDWVRATYRDTPSCLRAVVVVSLAWSLPIWGLIAAVWALWYWADDWLIWVGEGYLSFYEWLVPLLG